MRKYILITLLVVVFVSFGSTAHAETNAQRKARLQLELTKIETEIKQQQVLLDSKSGQRRSLERDVSVLNAQVRKAELAIRQRNINISEIVIDVKTREKSVSSLNEKIAKEKASLAQLLRKTNEIDNLSFVEMLFGKDNLSTFFSDLDSFAVVKVSLSNSFKNMNTTIQTLTKQKQILQSKQYQQQELKHLQVLEENKVQTRKAQKKKILTITKGQEKIYQKIIKEKQKTAAEIRAALFSLRGTAAIPFGDAYTFALQASKATNVRPALILGILAQETNLGENVGTGNWKVDMHPTRDRPVFRQIVSVLGLNPDKLPVSKKPWYGWGGAMGPAQFIPSTWVCYGGFINTKTNDCSNSARSFSWSAFWQGPWKYVASRDRLRKMMKTNTPSNPWDARTAIFAAATLMMDNGARQGSRASERLAALRYFAGWTYARNPSYAFYGDGVMELADKFQRQINILEGN